MGTKDENSGSGIVIHSKAASKKFIHENYEGFLQTLGESMEK